jgi:hypothetical protein
MKHIFKYVRSNNEDILPPQKKKKKKKQNPVQLILDPKPVSIKHRKSFHVNDS